MPQANPSESAGAQAHQNVNRPGDASHANVGEAFSGVAGGTPFSVESGVRLLPLRTVVAMPAGISRAPSGSSSGGVGIIYPFLTRVRQRANTNGNDERNGQSPNEPARSSTHPNQQSIPQSAGQFSSTIFFYLVLCVAYSINQRVSIRGSIGLDCSWLG